jgi:hypothetical protein
MRYRLTPPWHNWRRYCKTDPNGHEPIIDAGGGTGTGGMGEAGSAGEASEGRGGCGGCAAEGGGGDFPPAAESVPEAPLSGTTPVGELPPATQLGPEAAAQTAEATATDLQIINPNNVRFSQDSASYRFKDGRTIDDLADGLRKGTVAPKDVPSIRLVERDGKLFTLDNRRLAAFQKAGVDVPYRMATPKEVATDAFKFTTQNEGISIRIRGGPH